MANKSVREAALELSEFVQFFCTQMARGGYNGCPVTKDSSLAEPIQRLATLETEVRLAIEREDEQGKSVIERIVPEAEPVELETGEEPSWLKFCEMFRDAMKNYSVREMAGHLDISPSTVSRITQGKMCEASTYLKICRLLPTITGDRAEPVSNPYNLAKCYEPPDEPLGNPEELPNSDDRPFSESPLYKKQRAEADERMDADLDRLLGPVSNPDELAGNPGQLDDRRIYHAANCTCDKCEPPLTDEQAKEVRRIVGEELAKRPAPWNPLTPTGPPLPQPGDFPTPAWPGNLGQPTTTSDGTSD